MPLLYTSMFITVIWAYNGDLLLEGDEQSGADKILLEGDEQSGTDILELEGNE